MAKKEFLIVNIDKAKRALDKLTVKKPETKSVEDSLLDLKTTIISCVEKGYSHVEILKILEDNGINVKLAELRKTLK